jgi:hypothetical protein
MKDSEGTSRQDGGQWGRRLRLRWAQRLHGESGDISPPFPSGSLPAYKAPVRSVRTPHQRPGEASPR